VSTRVVSKQIKKEFYLFFIILILFYSEIPLYATVVPAVEPTVVPRGTDLKAIGNKKSIEMVQKRHFLPFLTFSQTKTVKTDCFFLIYHLKM
jgi:hypothetical protein